MVEVTLGGDLVAMGSISNITYKCSHPYIVIIYGNKLVKAPLHCTKLVSLTRCLDYPRP
jgi:hypothetical protein